MKIRHLPNKEIQQTLKINLYRNDIAMIERYRDYVIETSGVTLDTSEVMTAMVKTFLDDDKAFQKWVKKNICIEPKIIADQPSDR